MRSPCSTRPRDGWRRGWALRCGRRNITRRRRAPRRDPGGAPLSRVWPRRAPSRRTLSTIARRHPREPSTFKCFPCALTRQRFTRRRPAGLHPVPRDARPRRHTHPATNANDRVHPRLRPTLVAASPPCAPRNRIIPVLEVRAARLKLQEASSARLRTGGLRSTPDCAAASRSTNPYFAIRRRARSSAVAETVLRRAAPSPAGECD